MSTPTPWSLDDLVELRRRYGSTSDADLALHFGREAEDVVAQAAELGLAKNKAAFPGLRKMPRWTKEEIATLRWIYPDTSNLEISRQLGRSVKSVMSKAKSIGLKKDSEHIQLVGLVNRQLRRYRGL